MTIEVGKDHVITDPGTGELMRYPDTFGNVSQEDVERAQILEQAILDQANQVEMSYLLMARDLSEFKRDRLYLARGFDSFENWANSPDLKKISYRSAQRLVQIADEAIPLLEKFGLMDFLPPVATMGDLLPLLGDNDGEAKFAEAVKAVEGMSNRDAKRYIKELRGIAPGGNGGQPTFTAKVRRGDSYNTVKVFCADEGGDYYETGTLMVKPKDWAQFEKMFNARFITYVD